MIGGAEHRRLSVRRTSEPGDPGDLERLIDDLDSYRGVLLCSSYEYAGRYRKGSCGFIKPPIAVSCRERSFRIDALNARGAALLPLFREVVGALSAVEELDDGDECIRGVVRCVSERVTEEQRSRRASIFTVLRALLQLFHVPADPHLGLYGAFGYDLVNQFEVVDTLLPRPATQRDLVLYIPDDILVVDDHGSVTRHRYDFEHLRGSTVGLDRDGARQPYRPAAPDVPRRDQPPGGFARMVSHAKDAFRRGDLFEVVLSQAVSSPCPKRPSELFREFRQDHPTPFGALLNLGDEEYLVSASPEMYVRVNGDRVESCPISGTVRRGEDALGDATQIRSLLNSDKDESELTMCADVDRNDKSRICEPGSVQILGRRQVEVYSKVIHTVDHIEGRLLPGRDAIDAFLTHMWAVTVTGAPKLWAMSFIERHERSPRGWYGGAIGHLAADGSMSTGVVLRTVAISGGVAVVRSGSTLLIDSDPPSEEREAELKAEALIGAIGASSVNRPSARVATVGSLPGWGRRVLLVDHQDSFVHTLGSYFRQTGAEVVTVRAPLGGEELQAHIAEVRPHVLVLSPGPGRPQDFCVAQTVHVGLRSGLPIFGVCLGLQGVVEYFGGALDVLARPQHGRSSDIHVLGGALFAGLPQVFSAGRYHSLHARRETLPNELEVTAEADGVVMAIEHRDLPVAAVQFHPESLMSANDDVGLRLIGNVMAYLRSERRSREVRRPSVHGEPAQCEAGAPMSDRPAPIRLLALCGSERPQGDTTAVLRWVQDHAATRATAVEIVQLADFRIQPCGPCGDCNRRAKPCALDDDVVAIVERMKAADGIIYAAPVHGFGLANTMQVFVERAGVGHLRFHRPLANKVGGVIVTGRRYSHVDVHAQLVNNVLLNRMILAGSGFPALVHTGDAPWPVGDPEGASAVCQMVDRMIDMCRVLAYVGGHIGTLMPTRTDNERQPIAASGGCHV